MPHLSHLLRRARARAALAAVLVACGSLAIQTSAALAEGLFDHLGVLGVSGLRMSVAAVVLLLVARPRVRGLSPAAWRGVVLYGVAMAAMNVLFYQAVARIPLGVAVTLEFLGPLAVAAAAARGWTRALPVVTLAGVALVAGGGGITDAWGLVFGLGAAVAFAGYTVLAGKVGEETGGLSGLALSVTVGALVLSPFQVAAAPSLTSADVLPLVLSGLLGVALAFSMDFLAVRLSSARVVGTLFAVDPVMGALVAAVMLGQVLAPAVLLGIVVVIASGALTIWRGTASEPAPEPTPGPVPAPLPPS
ncbi:EamA family transporter [Cellulomonas triticagri]|nr:EamA family transporter [Cellulomonas triticagri]